MTTADTEERLIQLELRSVDQQRLLEELSGVLHSHQQEIDRLHGEVASLRSRIADTANVGPAETPPHF